MPCDYSLPFHKCVPCEPEPIVVLLNRHDIDFENQYMGRRCHLKSCGATNLYLPNEPMPTHCSKCGKKIRNVKKIYRRFGELVRAKQQETGLTKSGD